jgi:hypothetical protein
VATVATNPVTYRETSFTVLPSLAFTGNPTAIETRSALRIRYDEIQEAIRIVTTSAQEYQIGVGGGGRKVRRADLPELRKERDEIRAQLTAEERASDIANGKGDPDALYTRFTPSY